MFRDEGEILLGIHDHTPVLLPKLCLNNDHFRERWLLLPSSPAVCSQGPHERLPTEVHRRRLAGTISEREWASPGPLGHSCLFTFPFTRNAPKNAPFVCLPFHTSDSLGGCCDMTAATLSGQCGGCVSQQAGPGGGGGRGDGDGWMDGRRTDCCFR